MDVATTHQLPTHIHTDLRKHRTHFNPYDAEPAPAVVEELRRDDYGLAEVNAPASRCTITNRCTAAEPKRVCSVGLLIKSCF